MTDAPAKALPDPLRAARRALRQELISQRETFVVSPGYAAAASALSEALVTAVAELEPACLGLYWPLRSESNAAGMLAADARTADISLALPYARRRPTAMEFRRWDGSAPTLADECGIGTGAGAAVLPDVVIVPCVGFTADGHRLGYGGGYYDRWLAAHPQVTAIGMAWSFAEIDAATFAAQPHDIPLALIVTERGAV